MQWGRIHIFDNWRFGQLSQLGLEGVQGLGQGRLPVQALQLGFIGDGQDALAQFIGNSGKSRFQDFDDIFTEKGSVPNFGTFCQCAVIGRLFFQRRGAEARRFLLFINAMGLQPNI